MKIILEQNITCTDSLECSDNICDKIEDNFTGLKLRADKPSDTVFGSVTISHKPKKHKITLIFYDQNEKPNKDHKSTLKKYSKINEINESRIKNLLK
jgi:hypothetical protein